MSVNALKKFVVKIKYSCREDSREGSGVMFKPTENSRYSYIFTAKHTFFKDDDGDHKYFEDYNKNELSIPSEYGLYITRELGGNPITSILNNKIYFLSGNKDPDFSFFIVEDDTSSLLDIYDTDDEPDFRKEDIIIIGYPKLSQDSISPIHSFGLRRRQRVTDNNNIEIFVSDGESSIAASAHRGGIKEQVKGISGAGVFVMGNKGTQKLCSIQYAGDYHNSFRCITLDGLVDSINERLREIDNALPPIQCGEKLIKDGEYLSFEDFTDFDFFKNKIKKSIIFKDNQEDYKEYLPQSDIKKMGKATNDELEKITKRTDKLSYQYAYLAILSHENKNYHAATRYFKKAEKLNKVHAHTLIYEKANREEDTQKILNTRSKGELVEEKIDRLDQLSKNPITSLLERREALWEIIFTLAEEKKPLQPYVGDFINLYLTDEMLRENYKYLELGYSFQYLDSSYDYAIYFFTIANNITKGLPQSSSNKELIIELDNMIIEGGCLSDARKIDAESIANSYLKERENHYFNKDFKGLLFDIYDDTNILKNNSLKRSKEVEEIRINISTLSENIELQREEANDSSVSMEASFKNTELSIDNEFSQLHKILNNFTDTLNISFDSDPLTQKNIQDIVSPMLADLEDSLAIRHLNALSVISEREGELPDRTDFENKLQKIKQNNNKDVGKLLSELLLKINELHDDGMKSRELSYNSSAHLLNLRNKFNQDAEKIKDKIDEKYLIIEGRVLNQKNNDKALNSIIWVFFIVIFVVVFLVVMLVWWPIYFDVDFTKIISKFINFK